MCADAVAMALSPRRRLFRWGSWFAAVNAALMAVVGGPYLWYYFTLGPSLAWLYAVVAYLGHLSALAFLTFLLLVPVIALAPRPRLVLPLGVVAASAGVSVLLLDTLVFAANRYHLDLVTAALLEPATWAFLALYFLVGLAVEAMLAGWVWKRTASPAQHRAGRYLALGLAACFLASHLVHMIAYAYYYVPVTSFTRYLPLYFPLQEPRRLTKLRAPGGGHRLVPALGRLPEGELRYPLAPLRCEPHQPLLNVLLVVVDGMRADALTSTAAPRIAAFASGAVRFDQHFSGGNVSRPGMFSLFYSLPAPYWHAFANFDQPPVLMDLFREYGYELGVFASAPVYSKVVGLDRTALARIPNLRLETVSPYPGRSGKDRTLTEEWLAWVGGRDPSRPFFGFLYYDAAMGPDSPEHYTPFPLQPGAPDTARLRIRYLNAVHYIDSLVGRVLDDLERRRLLDRTLVIVTSDHGMQFDEYGLDFDGHGTGFTRSQLQTPLVIRWPGRPSGRVDRRTSHFDVAPTLLTRLFGCANPASDYASGDDLFGDKQWEWVISADYTNWALVEPGQVTVVLSRGYEIRDENYRLIPHPTFPQERLRAALREMSRFYR
jgi:membrane-anchored protein YejM (alkaline phosphatase superfamily)